jgi:hypothetical protein
MSWADEHPPGLLAAADQELMGLRGWLCELAAEHPNVKERMGAMEALFTLAKHIENAVDARPGMPNSWLIAAAAVDALTVEKPEADRWEKRYAEMLKQRDAALQELTQAKAKLADPAVRAVLELIEHHDREHRRAEAAHEAKDEANARWLETQRAHAAVVEAARAAVANIVELHPQIREADPEWFHDSTLRLVAAIDALDSGAASATDRAGGTDG